MVKPRDLKTMRRSEFPDWSLWMWLRWRYVPWAPTRSEWRVAYIDLRAWLGGWCNDCPKTSKEAGGYAYWRCERRRGHTGMHRTVNYVWGDDGYVSYLPVPPGRDPEPRSPWRSRRSASGSWRYRMKRDAA
jgi:hypothetical protein